MLINKNQVIISGLLALGVAGFGVATALQFNDRIEYRIGNRIESNPAWLVPPKAEFKGLERGYGGLKILLALLGTGGMVTVMLIARHEGEQEPIRQKIKGYQNQAYEFSHAAESAYQMAKTQMEYKKLLEADEVAFEGEIEEAYCQSLGIDPQQQQATLTGTATLDATNNPGDKVQDVTSAAIEPDRTQGPKIPNLSWYPSVLIYGAPGSGKTHFAAEEIAKRRAVGHRVIVLDPHAAYGAWEGCEVVGGGMNYGAIDVKLAWFAGEVARRYERVQSEPNPKFEPLTFVCDEFTRWGSKVANSTEFFEQLVTDIRKVEMFGIIISHARTLAGLANAKGFASLRDEAFLEIEILGEQGANGRATPKFEAMVKLPGGSLTDRTLVKLAKHSAPGVEISAPKPTLSESTLGTLGTLKTPSEQDTPNAGTPYGTRAERISGMLADILAGTLETAVFYPNSPLEQDEKLELAKLIIAEDLGLERTIWLLWGIRRGGRNHALYTEARAMLDRLINGEE
ncbi:type IV secretory system conjugative DNA transfer family protein [Microcoleus sp. A006_D1]|uniref:type IV secretory system conjugative DNA transfer family protein n=1 Tax=Microcoleus sp. A006_D1 TaxID=3055267 RepID=UPI002FD05BC5